MNPSADGPGASCVLVVDDDPFMRNMLPDVLTEGLRASGAPAPRIKVAATPEGAIQLVLAHPADEPLVVLCDFNLKAVRNGLDVLAEVARTRPDAVRILFSGHAREEIPGIDGAPLDGFIEKPFRIWDILPPLHAIIRRAEIQRNIETPPPRRVGASHRAAAARSIQPEKLVPALVKAATKGESARAQTLYDEAKRRGVRKDAERETIRTLAWQTRVLEMIADGAPLSKTLTALALAVEGQAQGMLASVLLTDASGKRLVHGAAPNLPPKYVEAIDGVEVGPSVGSCGTAVHERRCIVVTHIQEDPLWAEFKDLAGLHGLAACWSMPIMSPRGKVLGTFALYYREPRAPSERELELIELAANLCRAAIESDQDRRDLRLAESRKAAILAASLDAVVTLDAEGRVVEWNPAAERLFGYTAEAAISRPMRELVIPPGRRRDHQSGAAWYLPNGEPHALDRRMELTAMRADGTEFPIELTVVQLTTAGPVMFTAFIRDLTGRKDAEIALRRAQEWLDVALTAAGMGAWSLDLETDTAIRTLRHDEIFGYPTLQPVWGKARFLAHVHEDDRQRIAQAFDDAIGATTLSFECRIRRADEEIRWIRVQGRTHHEPATSSLKLLGVVEDITQRKAAEAERDELIAREKAALKEAAVQREHLRETLLQAPVAIARTVGPDHVFELANGYYELISGRQQKDILGRSVREVFPEVTEDLFGLLDGVYRTGEPFIGSSILVRIKRNGAVEDSYFDFVYAPVRNARGAIEGILVVAHEVTAQVRARETILTLNEQLERGVEKRTAALAAANHDLEAFGSVVSHDLRAPLRAVNYLVSATLRSLPPEWVDARENLSKAEASTEEMERMIEGLLALSRSNRDELQRTEVDLSELAHAAAAARRLAEPLRHVEMNVQPNIQAWGDRRLLRSVMENLIGNAWKFTADEPTARIDVNARVEGGMLVCTVQDNGIGFDMARAQMLFQPFQRLHSAEGRPGLGIGLATVRRIVLRHGGRTWADAEDGKGATFHFALPVGPPDA